MLFLAIVVPTLVHADFYVIPVIKKMKNVVTVAKSGGQYTDVRTAIDSIADAGADNPYLVYIGPGVYTVTSPIQLKAYVTVMGSGREATLLKGALSTNMNTTSAVILGADNASLAQLSVENTGGGYYSIGVYNYYSSPAMTGVTATASGGRGKLWRLQLRPRADYPQLHAERIRRHELWSLWRRHSGALNSLSEGAEATRYAAVALTKAVTLLT